VDESILEIKDLNKSYDKFKLRDVSLKLPRGYIMGFIGANGAGKTTTIKLIMNMIQRDSGEINVFGKDNIKYELQIKDKTGYVGETPVFYDDMTVGWTANFASKFYSNWDNELFNQLLTKFNIDKNKKISQLSKGMKMKTGLVLALSHHPELLILDEPTSGLDPIVRDELLDILLEFIQDEMVEKSMEEIRENIISGNESKKSFDSIAIQIDELNKSVAQINQFADEQLKMVSNVSQLIEQTAAGSEETAASTEEISASSQNQLVFAENL
jgi:ABC-type multidrug transport system ATPase subunit